MPNSATLFVMKTFLQNIVILSLVLVSLEGAADVFAENFPHGDETSHLEEFGHGLQAHGGELSDAELDGEHCQHCCHGHCSASASTAIAYSPLLVQNRQSLYTSNITERPLAPPTPPPNT